MGPISQQLTPWRTHHAGIYFSKLILKFLIDFINKIRIKNKNLLKSEINKKIENNAIVYIQKSHEKIRKQLTGNM